MSVSLTWLGHATWLLDTSNYHIIIDPFLTDNPKAGCAAEDIEVDYVLLTHGHFDHVADAAAIANRCNATLVANYEIATWFATKHGVQNTLGMNIGGSASLPFGKLTMTHAIHSSQLPDGSYGGNPGGFLLTIEGKRICFAGDTALFSDMQLIGKLGVDVAILPIGDLFTMGPEDSVQAARWLGASLVLPSHYGTWPPIEQNAEAWAQMIEGEVQARAIVPVVNKPFSI